MLPHVYLTVWEDLQNTTQVFEMKEGGTGILTDCKYVFFIKKISNWRFKRTFWAV